MPYIDTYSWFDAKLCPAEGESYQQFMDRCVSAIQQLKPDMPQETIEELVNQAWASHIFKQASEVTVTLKREFYSHQNSVYLEGYFGDWQIVDVHHAVLPQLNVTYSSVEKMKANGGDTFRIAKSQEDQQLVFGWANVAVDENGQYPLDWDGDFTDPADLEKAAYEFVLKYRATGEQHQGEVKGHLVESVMFTKEKQRALGIPEGILPEGWWVGFHIPDKEVFAKIKKGEYQMFSVEGTAKRLQAQ